MKSFKRFALVPAVALLVFASGCNMVDTPPDPNAGLTAGVLIETFCVQFDEHRTTGTFASEVVCDQFQEDILAFIAAEGVSLECVLNVSVIGAKIQCVSFSGSHSFDVTSSVSVKRTDIADGPQTFLTSQTVTIPDKCDEPPYYRPKMGLNGVMVVNRALTDLADGNAPVLVAEMVATDVDPEPSVNDPLIFSWQACVKVHIEVNKELPCGGN